MSDLQGAIEEIQEFVTGLSIDSPLYRDESLKKFNNAYRNFHSLLIWNMLIPNDILHKSEYGLHFREGLSDISHGFALISISFYKPSRMMARSAVENFLRVCVAVKNGDFKIRSVHGLFDVAISLYKDNPYIKNLISRLKKVYSELCLTVHSVKDEYLSLSIPFDKLIVFDKRQFELTIGSLKSVSCLVNQLIYCLYGSIIYRADHRNRDFVLDTLPRSLKKAMSS